MNRKYRLDKRFNNSVFVTCNESGCKVAGLCINFNDSGMCVFSKDSFQKGALVDVDFKSRGTVIKKAKVVWCKETKNDLYQIGIDFNKKIF
jgi:hypothetical protein